MKTVAMTHMTPTAKKLNSNCALVFTLTLLFIVTAGGIVHADSVRIKDFWYDSVTITGFAKGKISFTNAFSSTVTQDLNQVTGFKIDAISELQDAEEAFEDKMWKRAYASFVKARGKVAGNKKWLQQWVEFRLAAAADRSRMGAKAIDHFIKLAATSPDPYLLQRLPESSIQFLSPAEHAQALEKVTGLMRRVRDAKTKKQLSELSKALKAFTPKTTTTKPTNGGTTVVDPITDVDRPLSKIKPLPREMDKEKWLADEVSRMLRRGELEQVVAETEKRLKSRDEKEPFFRWYQRGVAQRHLADKTTDPSKKKKLYKDAGLCFMRVVILAPQSAWMPFALIEAGLVHQKLGRYGHAQQLYRQADRFLDLDDEPEMSRFRDKLGIELRKLTVKN